MRVVLSIMKSVFCSPARPRRTASWQTFVLRTAKQKALFIIIYLRQSESRMEVQIRAVLLAHRRTQDRHQIIHRGRHIF